MKRYDGLTGIIIRLALLCCLIACTSPSEMEEEGSVAVRETGARKVNFKVGVALPERSLQDDAPGLVYPEDPISNKEMIRTLRLIVVRPDNIVEINRAVTLATAVTKCEFEELKVVGGERKTVYLFANEATLREDKQRLVNYDLGKIREGGYFPKETLENLQISLQDDEQVKGYLPMCECHEVDVPEEDYQTDLFVTRAAVKFTVRITNNGTRDARLAGLTVDKVADREFYLPRNAEYEERTSVDGRIFREIVGFDVPESVTYHTLDIYAMAKLDKPLLAKGGKLDIAPVYQLEGKYTDPDSNGLNHAVDMTLEVDGMPVEFTSYLPNLSQLPRNTNVKINITVQDTDVKWVVDVIPYSERELEPDFGL